MSDNARERKLALNPSSEPELCFFCGRPTYLIDLNYQAPYCGRHEGEIAADLAGDEL